MGCLIFRMLTKRNLFRGTSFEEVMFSNKHDDPRDLLEISPLNINQDGYDMLE